MNTIIIMLTGFISMPSCIVVAEDHSQVQWASMINSLTITSGNSVRVFWKCNGQNDEGKIFTLAGADSIEIER
jgi:hypothetical protein